MPEVKGFHPITGEEVTIKFQGNFPIKDPDSNVFVLEDDESGKSVPRFPGRDRVRFQMLDANGEEVLDTRPMASSVMFSDHIPPEKKIADMMKDANFRAQLRAYLSEQEGVDTYDDFDYDDDLLFDPESPESPYEMVHDADIGKFVPRALQGTFKAVKKAIQKGTGPLATPTPTDPQSGSEGPIESPPAAVDSD